MTTANTSESSLRTLFVLIIALAAFVGGWKLRECEAPGNLIRTDTLVIERWDTIRIEKPTEKTRYVYRTDTITLSDTTIQIIVDTANGSQAAIIPIERIIYRDSVRNAKYEAYLSGYRAALDSISINCLETERIITKIEREKARRLGVGIQLGVGVSAQGLAAPYAGVGIHYRLW